jgi:hypothetical protein
MRNALIALSLTRRLPLPAAGVPDRGRRVPRGGHDLVVRLLDPNGVVVVKMDDQAQRFAIVKSIFQPRISRHTGDSSLDPRVSGEALRLRQTEVFHQPKSFGVRSILGVEKSMRTGVFVGIAESNLIAQDVLLQKPECMAQPDVVIGLRQQAGPNKIGTEHNEQVCRGPTTGLRRWLVRSIALRNKATTDDQGEQRKLTQSGKLHLGTFLER